MKQMKKLVQVENFNLILFLFFFTTKFIGCSILEVCGSDTCTTKFELNTPPFSLGNLDFPVQGKAILSRGCKAFQRIEDSAFIDPVTNRNFSTYVVLVDYDSSDAGCFWEDLTFECQNHIWCGGVLANNGPGWKVPGMQMWSVFEKHRPRSDYRVPLVCTNKFYFDKLKNSLSKNLTNMIILTHDPNPWEEMYTSLAFFIYFRVLTTAWSIGCLSLIFCICFLYPKKAYQDNGLNSKFMYFIHRLQKARTGFKLKSFCLVLQAVGHVFRIVFFSIDPFWSQQQFGYLLSWELNTVITTCQIASNIMLIFVLRELTHAKQIVDMKKQILYASTFVIFFWCLDFAGNTLAGLRVNLEAPGYISKAFFYIIGNIALGIWYFKEGYIFIKKCEKQKKVLGKSRGASLEKKVLTQISLINSIGMILFGLGWIFVPIPDVFGTPWGYFWVFAFLTVCMQVASLVEIFLFCGVAVSFSKVKLLFKGMYSEGQISESDLINL